MSLPINYDEFTKGVLLGELTIALAVVAGLIICVFQVRYLIKEIAASVLPHPNTTPTRLAKHDAEEWRRDVSELN